MGIEDIKIADEIIDRFSKCIASDITCESNVWMTDGWVVPMCGFGLLTQPQLVKTYNHVTIRTEEYTSPIDAAYDLIDKMKDVLRNDVKYVFFRRNPMVIYNDEGKFAGFVRMATWDGESCHKENIAQK